MNANIPSNTGESPSVALFKEQLGMKPGQLLISSGGELGDILDVDFEKGTVTVGPLGASRPLTVPVSNIKIQPKTN